VWLQGVANVIAAAKEAGGVQHVVLVSSMLTDPANRCALQHGLYSLCLLGPAG